MELAGMDAVGFLAERGWPPARRLALLLCLATAVSGLGFVASTRMPAVVSDQSSNPLLVLLWGLFISAAGLLSMASLLGLWLVVPLYAVYRTARTLGHWGRQGRVRDMLSAGVPPRRIHDALAWRGASWWLAVSWPSLLLFLLLLWDEVARAWLALALLAWGGGALTLGAVALYAAAWSGSGRTEPVPAFTSLLVVLGLPALGVMVAGLQPLVLLAAFSYALVAARGAALFALTQGGRAHGKRAHPSAQPPWENPIAAREWWRGDRRQTWARRGALTLGFVFTTAAATALQAPWLFLFLLAGGLLAGGYGAAAGMSRAVADEEEGRTLEGLRSTLISSRQFLRGWVFSLVRQRVPEGAILVSAVWLVLALRLGPSQALAEATVLGLSLALVLPLGGAYLGACLAVPGKSREEVSGQVMILYGALTAVCGPQFLAASGMMGLPGSLLVLILGGGGLCAGLEARALRLLDQNFLPQK